MKRRIRLSESDLHRVIAESVKRVLKEGKGKFTDLYHDKNVPKPYGHKVEELQREIESTESYLAELRKELESYEDANQAAFEDYAQDRYGLSKDNLDKNWEAFCDNEDYRNFEPSDYPEGGTGYYG